MARAALVAVGFLASASAADHQVLFQRRGVASKASAAQEQLAMVQALARDVIAHKRPLTEGEKSVIDLIDNDIIKGNLDTITQDDKADEAALQSAADAVAACESPDLDTKITTASKMDQDAKAEWVKHETCRSEEKNLKDEMEAAKARLISFLSESKNQLPSCDVPGTEAEDDAVTKFMDDQAAWYGDHEKTYNDKLSDWNTRTTTYQNKVVECDAQQNKAQQATCNWRSYVLASQTEYDSCRTRTLKAYADVLVLNKANSEDYKTEWEAMKRLQCYMNVLRNDIQASGAELAACQEQTVSLSDFDVVEPTVAAKAQAKLDGMGDMSKDWGCAK
jgi:hypothetical protein